MNAVEIESAISELALLPFDDLEFPFAFLAAFGNKETTLKRLRSGNNNERLEKLFELYTKMTASVATKTKSGKKGRKHE